MQERKPFAVFVHGLFGWGERDPANRLLPEWGMGSGNVLKDLRSRGYDCCAPSLGPLSSAWDRACELYAQLTGTRVDYGAAHAAAHGHARYGRDYTGAAMLPGWGEDRPADFIGHSFGGATSRLLVHLLAEGDEAERTACGDPSPLFLGGKAGWVRSVTCLASPHNGSTMGLEGEDGVTTVAKMNLAMYRGVRLRFRQEFDFNLDQFGAAMEKGEDFVQCVHRMAELVRGHDDSAFLDLSVDGALALNARVSMPENVWYFSVPTCKTSPADDGITHRPDRGITPMLKKSAAQIGSYYDHTTPGGVAITREWCPNDGMVPTVSALCPLGAPQTAAAERAGSYPRGVWNVLPVRACDHLEMIGGFGHFVQTRRFYRGLLARLEGLKE